MVYFLLGIVTVQFVLIFILFKRQSLLDRNVLTYRNLMALKFKEQNDVILEWKDLTKAQLVVITKNAELAEHLRVILNLEKDGDGKLRKPIRYPLNMLKRITDIEKHVGIDSPDSVQITEAHNLTQSHPIHNLESEGNAETETVETSGTE